MRETTFKYPHSVAKMSVFEGDTQPIYEQDIEEEKHISGSYLAQQMLKDPDTTFHSSLSLDRTQLTCS